MMRKRENMMRVSRAPIDDPGLPLKIYPASILRRVAEPVSEWNEDIAWLISRMHRTLEHHHGLGLAAPQVGRSVRVILVRTKGEIWSFVNPVILDASLKVSYHKEGCLSMPGIFEQVERAETILLETMTPKGGKAERLRLDGMTARIVQHEVDHLDGILFTDWAMKTGARPTKKRIKRALKEFENRS